MTPHAASSEGAVVRRPPKEGRCDADRRHLRLEVRQHREDRPVNRSRAQCSRRRPGDEHVRGDAHRAARPAAPRWPHAEARGEPGPPRVRGRVASSPARCSSGPVRHPLPRRDLVDGLRRGTGREGRSQVRRRPRRRAGELLHRPQRPAGAPDARVGRDRAGRAVGGCRGGGRRREVEVMSRNHPMSKSTITRLFVGGILAFAVGLALVPAAVWAGISSNVALTVTLVVVGSLALIAGAVAVVVSWIGALFNTVKLDDKAWFASLVALTVFGMGVLAMVAYVLAGPDSTSQSRAGAGIVPAAP